MTTVRYHVGDLVRMRKEHPCGSDVWEVLRVGMDFRLKCFGCGHIVMLPRPQFERNVKELLPPGVKPEVKLRPRPRPVKRPAPAKLAGSPLPADRPGRAPAGRAPAGRGSRRATPPSAPAEPKL